MSTGYYPQFDLIRIAAAGARVSLPSETINVYNVTTSTSLGTLVSDANGVIVEGSFPSVSPGDLIRFSHATYPGLAYATLQATQEDAYLAVENDSSCFVVENLYTPTTNTRMADLYARDADNPDVPPFRIGGGKTGETAYIPFPQAAVVKNLDIFPIALDENLNPARTDFYTTNFQPLAIPALPTGPPGGFDVTEIEIDFGSQPVFSASFTIVDAGVSSASKIMILPSGNTAGGRAGNDFSWDAIQFTAVPGTGEFTLDAVVLNGTVLGKRKVFYTFA